MDTEQALMHAGVWGKYQKILYVLMAFAVLPNGFIMMHFTLSNYEPRHRCRLPGEMNDTDTKYNNSLAEFFIPKEADENGELNWNECRMYLLNDSKENSSQDGENTTRCTQGYVYNLESYQKTAVSELSMVCDDDWKAALAISMYQVGNGIGSLLMTLSDRFGRRPIFLLSCLFHALSGVLISASWVPYAYILGNLLCGIFAQINYCVAFILAAEMTDESRRNFMSTSSWYSFSLGYSLVALFGYFLQNWRWYLIALSTAAAVLYLPNVFFFLESPSWLIQKGRNKDAMKILRKVAKINSKEKDFEQFVQRKSEQLFVKAKIPDAGVVDSLKILFRSGIGRRCLVLAYDWFAISLMYHSIAYYSTSFSQDRFLNILYAGLSELPACVCGFYAANIIGRPRSLFGFMMVAGLTSIILPFIPEDVWAAKTTLSVLGKTAITAAFYVTYLSTAEIAPTLQRSSFMSICSTSARLSSFLAPFLMYMKKVYKPGPSLIIGGLAMVAGVLLIVFLPETRGIKLPDTIAEARNNRRTYGIHIFKTPRDARYTEDQKEKNEEGRML